VANIDEQKLRAKLLKYYVRYNIRPINIHALSQDFTVEGCASIVNEITAYLVAPIEKNIKCELVQLFKDSENPEIPYFEVVMDVMQFMNDFVGDPHTVELIFTRVNDEVARRKLELDEKVFYSDREWTPEVAEPAIQQLRDSGTERDYQLMIDKLLETLTHSTNEAGLKMARMRLTNIIKKHSVHEMDQLGADRIHELAEQ